MTQERVSIGEMARCLGVAVVTLRRWDRAGKLTPLFRTIGGYHRYGDAAQKPDGNLTVLYSRVSCHGQKSDLGRQEVRLTAFVAKNIWLRVKVISELGSGMNFRKSGLLRRLDVILNKRISRLVVKNKDRLISSERLSG